MFVTLIYIIKLLPLKQKNVDYSLIYVFIVSFLCFGMLRGKGIGTDYYNYHEIFYNPDSIEPGFKFFAFIVKKIGGSFHSFIAIFFLISFSLKIYCFKRLSLFPFLSILLYLGFWLLTYDMNGIRQGMALGFVGVSLIYLEKRDLKKHLIFVLLGVLSHYSTIVFLPFYYITKTTINYKSIYTIFSVALILAILGVAEFIIVLLSGLFGIDNHLVSRALSYGMDNTYNNNILYSFSTIHRIFIFIITCIFVNRIKANENLKNIFIWASLINITIYLLFSQFELIATRLSLYYRFTECIFLSYLPSAFSKDIYKISIGILLCIYVMWQIHSTISIPGGNLYPYYSIFKH